MNMETQRAERIEKQLIRTIRIAGAVPSSTPLENVYFPINISQVRDLEEGIHTRIEMLNLSKKAEDAAKVVMNEYLWQWFYEAQDNSVTSARGCIAPVVLGENFAPNTLEPYGNRWGWSSEKAFKESIEVGEDDQSDGFAEPSRK